MAMFRLAMNKQHYNILKNNQIATLQSLAQIIGFVDRHFLNTETSDLRAANFASFFPSLILRRQIC